MVDVLTHPPSDGSEPPWGFRCHLCEFQFPDDVTMGVLAAHFETEHDGAQPEVDLVGQRLHNDSPDHDG